MRCSFIAYLHNSVFPPLLSAEEESDCLARLAENDEEARNKLIEHNLRLVAHICKNGYSERRKIMAYQWTSLF